MSKKIKYTVEQLNEMARTTPSKLLLIAVEDMRALRKKKNIKFNMNDWVETFESKGKKVCAVCMAGATLNNRFGAKNFADVCKLDGGLGVPDFADAINDMRTGMLPYGIEADGEVRDVFDDMIQKTYRDERNRAELRTYERAAKFLASKGL
jgi:hypothetical protein